MYSGMRAYCTTTKCVVVIEMNAGMNALYHAPSTLPQEYVFGKGPSPVQAAAFTNNAVQRVYQVLDLFLGHPGLGAFDRVLSCLQKILNI